MRKLFGKLQGPTILTIVRRRMTVKSAEQSDMLASSWTSAAQTVTIKLMTLKLGAFGKTTEAVKP